MSVWQLTICLSLSSLLNAVTKWLRLHELQLTAAELCSTASNRQRNSQGKVFLTKHADGGQNVRMGLTGGIRAKLAGESIGLHVLGARAVKEGKIKSIACLELSHFRFL